MKIARLLIESIAQAHRALFMLDDVYTLILNFPDGEEKIDCRSPGASDKFSN